MKKIFFNFFIFLLFILTVLIVLLSTIGIETNRFNDLISKKINQSNENINIKLSDIEYKIDLKEVSLFLQTSDPKFFYRDTIIPVKKIKVFVDFFSIFKSETRIKKINFILNQLDIEQIKYISTSFKPSNFTSFLKNKVKEGKLNTEIEVFFDNNNILDNFIAKGSVSNLKAQIYKDLILEKTKFNFFADKTDILIKNVSSKTDLLEINEGDIKISLASEIQITSNFETKLKYSKINQSPKFIKDINSLEDIKKIQANFDSNFKLIFDKTYKIKNYEFKGSGKIYNALLILKKPIKNTLLLKQIDQVSIKDSSFETIFNSKKNINKISGEYSFNDQDYLEYSLDSKTEKDFIKLNIDLDYSNELELKLINYDKPKDKIAQIFLDLDKNKENININKASFIEGNNSIIAEGLNFEKGKFLSLKKVLVKTFKEKEKNNDFKIEFRKKIMIKGSHFDATNLHKILSRKTVSNIFSKINKEIEIDFTKIDVPLSEKLESFKLIGQIQSGKFVKISSKGDFGNNNYLDITMKSNNMNEKRYLEIYSDLTRPLLTEYSFFKGLSGGKLLFSSIIHENSSNSKLMIENFKVINAPGMVKLLSLADLGGLADLAEGEGLSFDILEIEMEQKGNSLKINEILALGPSISVLMEGYQNPSITSLRGTLIPAKTFNKMISKIPLIGDIVIPKEAGEGLFGISFKMKGPPGKIKTTINPIRTLTPRFIQKIIDKNKETK